MLFDGGLADGSGASPHIDVTRRQLVILDLMPTYTSLEEAGIYLIHDQGIMNIKTLLYCPEGYC